MVPVDVFPRKKLKSCPGPPNILITKDGEDNTTDLCFTGSKDFKNVTTHFGSSARPRTLALIPTPCDPTPAPGSTEQLVEVTVFRSSAWQERGLQAAVPAWPHLPAADGLEAETRTPDPGPRQQSHEDTPGRFSGSRERGPGLCGGCGAAPTPRGPLARGAGALLCIKYQ